MNVRLRAGVGFDAKAGVWVAWCPALDIYSQDETSKEAQAALEEALALYVKHCYERRILDNVLADRGFGESDEYIDVRPHVQKQLDFDVTVPFPLSSGQT